ncbi:MAG: hypothetical protein ACKOC0_14100 [Cytophagales bacterium]
MWAILEFCLLAAIVLLSITEFFYPLLTGKPLFGSFRKVDEAKIQEEVPIEEKISNAKEKVKEIKDVQEEVNKKFKSAEQLKAEADDLLNNKNN